MRDVNGRGVEGGSTIRLGLNRLALRCSAIPAVRARGSPGADGAREWADPAGARSACSVCQPAPGRRPRKRHGRHLGQPHHCGREDQENEYEQSPTTGCFDFHARLLPTNDRSPIPARRTGSGHRNRSDSQQFYGQQGKLQNQFEQMGHEEVHGSSPFFCQCKRNLTRLPDTGGPLCGGCGRR